MDIHSIIDQYIRETGQARRVEQDGAPAVLFLDENEVIPLDDLAYNSELGFYRKSASRAPNTRRRSEALLAEALSLVTADAQRELDALGADAALPRLREFARQLAERAGCSVPGARQKIAKALRLRRGERIANARGGVRPGAGRPRRV